MIVSPTLPWWNTTVGKDSSRVSNAPFWPPGTHLVYIIQTDKIHIKIKNFKIIILKEINKMFFERLQINVTSVLK